MHKGLPNLQLQVVDNSIKSTTQAILLSNRGRGSLRSGCLEAVEEYGMAVTYLAGCSERTRDIYWPNAVKGLEAAMLCAFSIEDLAAFGKAFRECIGQVTGLQPDFAAELLQRFINPYIGRA